MEHHDLEQRGWDKMATLLDEHLPQEKKRRGAFWLWFGTGIGILLLAVGVWSWNAMLVADSDLSSRPQQAEFETNPQKNTEAFGPVLNENRTKELNTSNPDQIEPNTPNVSNEDLIDRPLPVQQPAVLQRVDSISIPTNGEPLKSKYTPSANLEADHPESVILDTARWESILPQAAAPAILPQALTQLDVHRFDPIPNPMPPALVVSETSRDSKKRSRFQWGVDVETNLGIGSNNLNAFGGGPFLSYQFNNGIRLESSLHYYYARSGESFLTRAFGNSSDEQESNIEPISAGDTTDVLFEQDQPIGQSASLQIGQLPFANAGDLFSSAHILNFQLGLAYQFHRKWSISSTVGLSRYFLPGDDALFGTATAFNATNFRSQSNLVRTTAIDWSGQMRYHFCQKISWSLGYRYSFNDLTRNEFQQNPLREGLSGLRTGIRFGF